MPFLAPPVELSRQSGQITRLRPYRERTESSVNPEVTAEPTAAETVLMLPGAGLGSAWLRKYVECVPGATYVNQALRSGSNPNYPETVPFGSSSDLK
jgi:hypothetical protein